MTGNGPYLLGGRPGGFRGGSVLTSRDVTIKSEVGVRPVLRLAADPLPGNSRMSALLPFSGGNVTLEGLTFELDPMPQDGPMSAVSTENTELTIRDCLFRQTAKTTGRNCAALRIRMRQSVSGIGDRPPTVVADSCHFDGRQIGIVADGPADIMLRDCTMGPGSPSIWIDNSKSTSPVPADIHLRFSSLIAGDGPVFKVEGALARILVDDCVIAEAGNVLPTLVAIDSPRNLTWRGRSNVYSGMHSYLEPMQKSEGVEAINDFKRWEETASEVREDRSIATTKSVWNSPAPLQELQPDQPNPTLAFKLATEFLKKSTVGARHGPHDVRLADPVILAGRFAESASGAVKTGPQGAEDVVPATAGKPATIPKSTTSDFPADDEEDSTSMQAMLPMSTPPVPDTTHPAASAGKADPATSGPPLADQPGSSPADRTTIDRSATTGNPIKQAGSHEDLIHNAEQFTNTLNRIGSNGGTLRIARDADFELPMTEFARSSDWVIEAEPGSRRPRIRFRPAPFAVKVTTDWSVLFNVHLGGALRLQGVDLLIPAQDPEAPRGGRQAAIGVSSGSKLTLTDCTITVAGRSSTSTSAAVVIQPGASDEVSSGDAPAASGLIKIRDSFIRTAGDCVSVASGRLLDLQLRNVLVAADGSLLHALGSAKSDRSRTALKMKIDQALARVRGGLVYLESTLEETELPLTDIEAENSIFSTAGQEPLLRLDGQGPMDRLHDRIIWRSEKVAYDEITTYRRDQILQTGVGPVDYTRSDWMTSFDPVDKSPITESVRFRKRLDLWRSAASLSKEDLELAPNGPAVDRGPDLRKIPSGPPVES